MKVTINNGWLGPIPGLSREAAVSLIDADATIVMARSSAIRIPKQDEVVTWRRIKLIVLGVTADAENLTITCRRKHHG